MTDHPEGMRTLLEGTGFELIPMKSTAEKAAAFPEGTTVSVTASPAKGMSATVELSEALAGMGLDVVPHLSARLTKSRAELRGILARLDELGADRAFVVGGDADDPGEHHDAMDLIRSMEDIGHPFTAYGVTGYPEGHPVIPDDALLQALKDKQPYASWVTTQMCFDTGAIERWIRMIRSEGIDLPVKIGIPGVTEITKLIGISMRIGVGTSLRFLRKNRSLAPKLLGSYSPDDLVERLAGLAEQPELGIAGLHVYTFNQVDATLGWYLDSRAAVA